MGKKELLSEIKGLSAEALRDREKTLAEQIMRDRMSRATDPSKDQAARKKARKELAQVLTQKSLLKGSNPLS